MTMTKASAQYFDQVAGEWDSIRAGYFSEAVREAAIARAYLRPEMVVADVGAGTGFMAGGLAPLVSRVHVIDGSPAMLEVARQNLSRLSNIEFHIADGSSLPLEDESIDVVFANMYLHHCPEPAAAIHEMVRILKPGGRLMITDMDAHSYAWFKEEMADEWVGFERSQVQQWLKEAGLVNVIVDCTGESCCAEANHPETIKIEDRQAEISVFLATGTRRIAMREQVQEAYSLAAQRGCSCGPSQEELQVPLAQDSCCSKVPTQDEMYNTFYPIEDLATVPAEAGQFSLGCGNPIALANLRPGEVVVDIGSGGGLDSFLAAQRVGPAGRVIGVDMTPAMLERATRAAQKGGYTNVEFRKGQAESLPVEDASVDVILSNCVINLTEDKGLVFQEAFRVLKPGGRLEVSDTVTSGALSQQSRHNIEEWSDCVSGSLPEAEYLDLIKQAGFTQVKSRRSVSGGTIDDEELYSVIVSARKP
jgi:arsenite methyltransferase